ncbi:MULTISPECIES: carbohydrate ABC transporter permease [Micromonospora]|uniref:carbohydrate ABC transporter permease n=1 Tax=Micromonospora TaxID=1873 RepID=UPI001B35B1B9|nr:carbohydrate ABC transporter permease [Micromonospora sp. M61]MBQ0982200.1 carbohydrate ABC transporter permease [Micromonospora sp. M61]WTI22314.1 carbohydrate ABC transporter permease [Micromonospora zamorensis]
MSTTVRSTTAQGAASAPRPARNRKPARPAVGRYVGLVVVLVVLVGPLVVPLLGAFKGPDEAMFGPDATVWPQQWSLDAFRDLMQQTDVLRAFGNSLVVCSLIVVSRIILSTMGGYILSRRGWKGRNLMTVIVLSALIFPFEAIMVSLFAQVRDFGYYNSLIGVWLPLMLEAFHILLMRAAFLGVPDELENAALLDGASEWQRFWHIFLPQVKGALVIVGLTSFIFAWEDYLWPVIVLRDDSKFTVMLAITQLESAFGFDYRVVLAGAIVAFLPLLLIFFLAQKYFFRGIEEGGLKF